MSIKAVLIFSTYGCSLPFDGAKSNFIQGGGRIPAEGARNVSVFTDYRRTRIGAE
jgi:hypothetical protein